MTDDRGESRAERFMVSTPMPHSVTALLRNVSSCRRAKFAASGAS